MKSIPIYKAEIDAGIGELVKASAFTYESPIIKIELSQDRLNNIYKSVADQLKPELAIFTNDPDLDWRPCVLASVGWNRNDDVFDAGEMWQARFTPIHKPVNYMHNEKDIIGHMAASLILDEKGEVYEGDTVLDKYDLVVASVFWKTWSDQKLQERTDKMLAAFNEGKGCVSMECLFKNFDYALISPDGVQSIVPRTEATAFLTKHLRIYGGAGEYEGNKVGRLLRNYSFCGKGVVERPANPTSLVLTNNPFKSSAEIIMADQVDKDLKETNSKLEAKIEKLERERTEAIEKAQKAEQEKLEKQIAGLKVDKEDLEKQLKEKTEAHQAVEGKLTETEKTVKALQADLAKANDELTKVKTAKVRAERVSKLVEVGVKSDEAEKVADKWAQATDEQFADIVALHKTVKVEPAAPATPAKVVETPNLEGAQADAEPAGTVADKNEDEELVKSTAGWIGQFINEKIED